MKVKLFKILQFLNIFCLLIVLFNILLFLSCSFDSSLINNNVMSSYKILNKQGNRLVLSKNFDIMNDNATDGLIMNEAFSIDNRNPYISYMKMRKNYKRDITIHELEDINYDGVIINSSKEYNKKVISQNYYPIIELGNFLDGSINTSLNYGRYWHGYLVLYRPLLLFFNITQIRILLFLTFLVLFINFIYNINKRFDKNIAMIFGISLVYSGYFSASISLECAPIFLVMIISSIILIKKLDKINNFYLYIFIIGCISNYVDFLTVPLITLGVPFLIYLLKLIEEKQKFLYCFKTLTISTFIWIFGYAGTWIAKWILYDVTIRHEKSMLYIGAIQSFYRMQNSNSELPRNVSSILAIKMFIKNYLIYTSLLSMGLIFINKLKISFKYNNKIFLFLIISLYPIIWSLLLLKHTSEHYYFVYRHSLLFILGILLLLNNIIIEKHKLS